MYTNFNDLHKAYGLQHGERTRDSLNYEEEKSFVKDCFDTYEYIGFADTFGTPYTGEKRYIGMTFSVLGRVDCIDENKNGANLECLPMWKIRLENGDLMNACPDEICLAERNKVCCNTLYSVRKTDWFETITDRLRDYSYGNIWTSGDEILCKTKDAANTLADMLECLYRTDGKEVVVNTGYYDPEEDRKNGGLDRYSGWWYVHID